MVYLRQLAGLVARVFKPPGADGQIKLGSIQIRAAIRKAYAQANIGMASGKGGQVIDEGRPLEHIAGHRDAQTPRRLRRRPGYDVQTLACGIDGFLSRGNCPRRKGMICPDS